MRSQQDHLSEVARLADELGKVAELLHQAAVAALLEGWSYDQVGKQMGISRQATWASCHADVDAALVELQKA